MNGVLYLVSTPIGNLKDISQRAKEVLSQVDWILAEDSRQTARLLQQLAIVSPKIIPHYQGKEEESLPRVIELLESGQNLALVSSAGTPLVSDPGYQLVKRVTDQGIAVVPIPGPSALLSALVASGLPTDSFLFLGFLPKKPGKRQKLLVRAIAQKDLFSTVIFYESPQRILKTLKEIEEIAADLKLVVGREMTKKFEEFIRGSVTQVLSELGKRANIKGELTVVLSLKNV
ncbi:MAG: 16S rRNA (cytidine(1402)-2'-O)-methyltransferase [Patescibacteria group bacterium]